MPRRIVRVEHPINIGVGEVCHVLQNCIRRREPLRGGLCPIESDARDRGLLISERAKELQLRTRNQAGERRNSNHEGGATI